MKKELGSKKDISVEERAALDRISFASGITEFDPADYLESVGEEVNDTNIKGFKNFQQALGEEVSYIRARIEAQ